MSAGSRSLGGLYGKVPAFADFVHRRLPMSFVEPWSAWIERSMRDSRNQLSERWIEIYLNSPPWRFALAPGAAGPHGWLGVLASSVDEVHRCYPITLAFSTPPGAGLFALASEIEPVLGQLEALALTLIDGRTTPDDAAAAADKLSQSTPAMRGAPILSRGAKERLQIGSPYATVGAMAAHLGHEICGLAAAEPLTAWWRRGLTNDPPASLVAVGLPSADLFVSLLDGLWRERGFAPVAKAAP